MAQTTPRPTSHKWEPIEAIANPGELTDGELTALLEVWKEQSATLPDDSGVAEFSKRLAREWAIETGIIEGVYTLDRGVTETLINEGIKASLITRESTNKDPDELAAILQDHLDALDGLFAFVKGERELTTSYIKEVHSALLRHVRTHTVKDRFGEFFEADLPKGVYKTQPNNPTRPDGTVFEFCPPEQTASEMDRLIDIHREQTKKGIPAEVGAAWLHHAFTQIHPFADGNGRVARLLASLVFIKAGGFPFLVQRDNRSRYIDALEKADDGDLKPLVRNFVGVQRRLTLGALQSLPKRVAGRINPQTPEEAIASVRDKLINRGDTSVIPRLWETTHLNVSSFPKIVHGRLTELVNVLNAEVGRLNGTFRFSWTQLDKDTAALTHVVDVIANGFGYQPSVGEWLYCARLNLPSQTEVVFVLHRCGRPYRGVVAGMLFVYVTREDGETIAEVQSATEEVFQVNYKDRQDAAEKRFRAWLEAGLTRALTMWRETL